MLTKSFLASETSHMDSSEEALTQHTVFTYFKGDIVCVVCVVSYLYLLYPEASDARTTFPKHLISCPHLRGGKKEKNVSSNTLISCTPLNGAKKGSEILKP